MPDPFDDGFAKVLPQAPSARMGHNNPPEMLPIGPQLTEQLEAGHTKLFKRGADLIAAGPRFKKIEGDKDVKRFTEFVRQIQEWLKIAEGLRAAEAEPYRLGHAQVNGVFGNDRAEALKAIKERLLAEQTRYNAVVLEAQRKADRERLANIRRDQERARQAQIAADQAAARAKAVAQKRIDDAAIAQQKAEAKRIADGIIEAAKLAPKPVPKAVVKAIEKAEIAQDAADAARDKVDDVKAEVTRAERAVHRPAAAITRSRSSNAVQSGQEFVDFRELDPAKLDLDKIGKFISVEHLEQAIRSYISVHADSIKDELRNKRQPIRGVEFWINLRTRVGG